MLTILGTSVQAIASIIAIAAALVLFSEEVKLTDLSNKGAKLEESINYLAAIYFYKVINFREEALAKGSIYVDKMMASFADKSMMVEDRNIAQYHAYNVRTYYPMYVERKKKLSGKMVRVFSYFIAFTLIFSLISMWIISTSSGIWLLNESLFITSLILSFVCIVGAAIALVTFYSDELRKKYRTFFEKFPLIKTYLNS